MTKMHHINCGYLHKPPGPRAVCHCLLLEGKSGLILVDTGIGLLDVQRPTERLGQPLIDMAGFLFDEADTAVRQIEKLGLRPADVKHIVLTHGDPDHAGGLADFPEAQVHVSVEEHDSITRGSWRYIPIQFAHGPRWKTWPRSEHRWFGLEARPLDLGLASEAFLVPLFGHTQGHCGVAIPQGDRWLLHVGDAYYLRVELSTDDHPVSALAAQRADDDAQRRATLEHLRRLHQTHAAVIDLCGYHDAEELLTA